MAMKLLKILFFTLFFIASLIAFLPKKNLYYYAEDQLAKYRTVVANEQLDEGLFTLGVEHADIYVEGIRAAKVLDARVSSYLLYSGIYAHKIRLSGMAKDFLPTRIENLKITYTLYNPLEVTFVADGEFGVAKGSYLLDSGKIVVHLQPSAKMKSEYANILRRMKREKNGEYSYEERL